VVDWQDVAYGHEYLDRVARVLAADSAGHAESDNETGLTQTRMHNGSAIAETVSPEPNLRKSYESDGDSKAMLAIEAARWIAVAMSYDDVIRVAELKTRAERSARLRAEIGADDEAVIGSEEFLHPRLEEVMGLMPVSWANWLDASPRAQGWLARHLAQGRRVQTHTLRGHLQLRLLAGLRRWRRGSRRHAEERAHLDAWLERVERALAQDRALAIELLRCRRLIKGYSDTHARGGGRFDQLMRAGEQLLVRSGGNQAAAALATLREAALRDAEGRALNDKLRALGLST
jgi:indolepyruvate ferredoxin oxidoreductase beta subunit